MKFTTVENAKTIAEFCEKPESSFTDFIAKKVEREKTLRELDAAKRRERRERVATPSRAQQAH